MQCMMRKRYIGTHITVLIPASCWNICSPQPTNNALLHATSLNTEKKPADPASTKILIVIIYLITVTEKIKVKVINRIFSKLKKSHDVKTLYCV